MSTSGRSSSAYLGLHEGGHVRVRLRSTYSIRSIYYALLAPAPDSRIIPTQRDLLPDSFPLILHPSEVHIDPIQSLARLRRSMSRSIQEHLSRPRDLPHLRREQRYWEGIGVGRGRRG